MLPIDHPEKEKSLSALVLCVHSITTQLTQGGTPTTLQYLRVCGALKGRVGMGKAPHTHLTLDETEPVQDGGPCRIVAKKSQLSYLHLPSTLGQDP